MTPNVSKQSIDNCGSVLAAAGLYDDANEEAYEEALREVSRWRTHHLVPMNVFQTTLRRYVQKLGDERSIVAQRLKRMPTIIDKLRRSPTMRLSQMQDIGGLRAIVRDVAAVREIKAFYDRSRARHQLRRQADYIETPRESGYRGIHLIYESRHETNPDADGLLLEVQLRTQRQHLWATAVETVGLFWGEDLKSGVGSAQWQQFFQIASKNIACDEGMVPAAASVTSLRQQLRDILRRDAIIDKLRSIHKASEVAETTDFAYHILETDRRRGTTESFGFTHQQRQTASEMYREKENSRECRRGDTLVVLVSMESIRAIRRAYPSFFLDVSEFTAMIAEMVS